MANIYPTVKLKPRIVLTYGTFDLFHIGHVRLLERARALGDKLYVGLSTDRFNLQKGKTAAISYDDRKNILESCRYVDLVFPETDWGQKCRDITAYGANVFVMGDDWEGKFDHLNELCHVVYLRRTQDVSTTIIRQGLRAAV